MGELETSLKSLCPFGYNGFKEYEPHKKAKKFICDLLRLDHFCHNIRSAYTWLERNKKGFSVHWEETDISLDYEWSIGIENNLFRPINIEIMANFLFVNDMMNLLKTGNTPYKNVLFIFLSFDPSVFDDLDGTFFDNVFVLDDQARQASENKHQLILNCYYKEIDYSTENLDFKWSSRLCKFSDIYISDDVCFHYKLSEMYNPYNLDNQLYI